MTRAEAETLILDKIRDIAKILKEYEPESNYFSLALSLKDNYALFNNAFWDNILPINYETEDLFLSETERKERETE